MREDCKTRFPTRFRQIEYNAALLLFNRVLIAPDWFDMEYHNSCLILDALINSALSYYTRAVDAH